MWGLQRHDVLPRSALRATGADQITIVDIILFHRLFHFGMRPRFCGRFSYRDVTDIQADKRLMLFGSLRALHFIVCTS